MARPAIAIIDEAQAFERKLIVHFRDVFRFASDQMRKAAGGDALCLAAQFCDHALENGIDQSDVSPEEADLQVVDGVCADDLCGTPNLYAGQTRCAGEESFRGDVESGGDRAAQKFAFLSAPIKICCGAEVDYEGRSAVFVKRAYAVGDSVSAHFA